MVSFKEKSEVVMILFWKDHPGCSEDRVKRESGRPAGRF